jgi:hypothetical protein
VARKPLRIKILGRADTTTELDALTVEFNALWHEPSIFTVLARAALLGWWMQGACLRFRAVI